MKICLICFDCDTVLTLATPQCHNVLGVILGSCVCVTCPTALLGHGMRERFAQYHAPRQQIE